MPSQDNAPAEKATGSHKYYCPLCMLYYAEVYKTHCCNNYVCQECSVMYISGALRSPLHATIASD